ncbi:Hpt domain-containing protein [Chitinolyticbacter meiyuanensis]|uniref:Hpt domain-containing protein n=1 Tax=Chitinolyticbacter meiyuanensis TaxID=682798 RepID=UPI0011E5D342|nr:Hpt domain-containing protein [Chitinolyticbacter meiyuanensis]
MSVHTEFDQGSLVWLKGELDQTLARAGEALKKYASEADSAHLKHAQTHLHQAVGALEMVELAGLARFCEEVEQLVAALGRGDAEPAAAELAQAALADAALYLDRIAAGAPNVPLTLAPRFAELAAARRGSGSGSELFFPQLSDLTLPGGLPARKIDATNWPAFVKQQRTRFEAGLLHWLRSGEAGAAVAMSRALSELAASQSGGVVRTFWWSAAGVLDAVAREAFACDLDPKLLLMRLNLQLRRLADGSGKVAERLFRDLLYVLANAKDPNHLGGHLARAFGLETLKPDFYGDALSPEAEAHRREARALRDELATAKELWSRVAAGQAERLPALAGELQRLAERSRELKIEGLDELWLGVAEACERLKHSRINESDALEMATALLLADNALAIYPQIAPDFADQAQAMRQRLAQPDADTAVPQLDAVSRAAQEKLLLAQLAQEMRSNLQTIEETLDGYFRDPERAQDLTRLDGSLRQLQGALMMLDRAEAVLLLQLCAQRIQRYASGEETPSGEQLEELAEGLSSLGFYVDALERDQNEADKLIGPALARLAGTSEIDTTPDELTTTLEAEPPIGPAAAEPEPLPEPAAPPRPLPQSDAAVDAELLDVYLEEAVEVLATIAENLESSRGAPSDREALTVIRRGFHTLKGSGRMVGLNHLGEAAWAIEQVLNKWLQLEHPASTGLLDLIADAHTAFTRWVGELSSSGTAQVDADELTDRADRLRHGADQAPQPAEAEPVVEMAAADVVPPDGETQIGDVVVSNTLFAIFREEALHHRERLNDGASRLNRGEALAADFLLSAHTLGGIASTAGFRPLGELAYALEHAVQELGDRVPAHAATLQAAIARVDNMLTDVLALHAPADPHEELAALNALHESLAPTLDAAPAGDELAFELPTEPEQAQTEAEFDLGDLGLLDGAAPASPPAFEDALAGVLDVNPADDAFAADVPVEPAVIVESAALIEEQADPLEGLALDLPELLDASQSVDETQGAATEEISLDALMLDVPAIELGEADQVSVEEPATDPLAPFQALLDTALQLDSETVVEPHVATPVPMDEAQPADPELQALTIALDDFDVPAQETPAPSLSWDEVVPAVEAKAEALSVSLDDVQSAPLPAEAEAAESFSIELDATEPVVEAVEPEPAPSFDSIAPPEAEADALLVSLDEELEVAEPAPASLDNIAELAAALETEFRTEPSRDDVPPAELTVIDETPSALEEILGSDNLTLADRKTELEAALTDDIDDQLLPIFVEEADELLPAVGAQLRGLHQGDAHQADELKRTLHTLKGSARMSGAMRIGEATHRMESRLLATGETLSQALLDELELDYDLISSLFDDLTGRGKPAPAQATAAPQAMPGLAQPTAAMPQTVVAGLADPEAKATIRVKSELVDELVNQAGEVSIARARIESEMLALKSSLLDLTENVTRLRGQMRELEIQAESQMQARVKEFEGKHENFDPLEFDRFTRLQEVTRFITESVNDVSTIQQNLLKNLDESSLALTAQARMTKELQQSLMRVRMVPFGSVSDRLYRLIRQTGKEVGKKVNLELKGGRVEIDRSVLEKMVSPFEHMLRNAIDHGLETTDERLAAGKAEFGEIQLEVRQEGNELVLTIRDDGRGLNLEKIRAKGLERNLITPEQKLNERDLMQLIFEPGFSTASAVTQLSGRGIGMDVVKNEISNLGGRIEVGSVIGQGTTFTIHLPLTLAVTQVLLVKAGTRLYAIPSVMIEQVQELKQEALAHLYETRSAEWLGSSYPFAYFPRLLGDGETVPEQKRFSTVLLLRAGASRMALHVDELVKNVEVVVKAIGPQLARISGVAGATVLGNGDIVLILNPIALLDRGEVAAGGGSIGQAAPEQLQTSPVVMVVDDSLTVRKITGRLLAREGYQVVTAKDGVDGLQQLGDVKPAVMLVDIEMPRMDGFEFTRNVRANEGTRDIPIIMITSRTADKHKNYAFDLGVNVFLGKPYQEDELLGHIRHFVAQQ